MQKLANSQKKYSVHAIELIMEGQEYGDGPTRLKNFIAMNYRVKYTKGWCERLWKKYHKVEKGGEE